MPFMLFDVEATFKTHAPKARTVSRLRVVVMRDVQATSPEQAVMVVRWRNPRYFVDAELKALRPRFAVVTHA